MARVLKRYKEGHHCPWCYDFDDTLSVIQKISKERFELLKDDRLTYECPECGCSFDDHKGAE
jgi:hypothetical protein